MLNLRNAIVSISISMSANPFPVQAQDLFQQHHKLMQYAVRSKDLSRVTALMKTPYILPENYPEYARATICSPTSIFSPFVQPSSPALTEKWEIPIGSHNIVDSATHCLAIILRGNEKSGAPQIVANLDLLAQNGASSAPYWTAAAIHCRGSVIATSANLREASRIIAHETSQIAAKICNKDRALCDFHIHTAKPGLSLDPSEFLNDQEYNFNRPPLSQVCPDLVSSIETYLP